MTRRRSCASTVGLACLLLCTLGIPAAAQAPTPASARLQFDIVGVRFVVDPPALTVPKNIATQINATLVPPPGSGAEAKEALAALTAGAQIEAELRGPSLAPTRIVVAPGQPIPIPPLAIPGDYVLDGIRLAKDGRTILDATATDGRPAGTIPIRVINEVLVASVTSKPLSLDDIRSKGIVIDERNFSAVNFQVAFNIDGTPFTISAPAVLPTPELLKTTKDRTVLVQQITDLNRSLAATLTSLPPQLDRPGLNFSIAALPFLPIDPGDNDRGFDTPPVTGLIVIPGNVAFLNQFFSALLLVANVAPDGSNLELRNLSGTITLPKGLDGVAGTYDAPGDDPLRLARIDGVGIQPVVTLAQRGPDGKLGTADDIFIVPPLKQGEGEFLIEGLREGSSAFDIAIDATLYGLPSGPVALRGQAAGSVFVRNPTFAITLAHPRTVRAGEPYTIYATVTNTSKSPANLVSVNLSPQSISGAQLLSDPTVTFASIPAGQSAVATYSMLAQLTGEVTFTSFTGDAAIGGGIRLETGVDERGVTLAANAIVLPKSTDALPPSLVAAAQRVLGQAFSVATAPAEALPDGVLYVKRQTVIDRGVELAEAGERVQFGEPLSQVLPDLLLDWLGNESLDLGFDQILRETDAGSAFLAQVAAIVAPDAVGGQALDYQRRFAQAIVSRAGALSVVASGPAAGPAPPLTIASGSGGAITVNDGEGGGSSIASGVLMALASGGDAGQFAVIARPDPDRYSIELTAQVAGSYNLGVVVPTGSSGQLQQLSLAAVALEGGGRLRIDVDLSGGSVATVSLDRNGDGVPDAAPALSSTDLVAGPPRLIAVRQLESSAQDVARLSDPAAYGLLVGALFDTPVTKVSAEDKSHYQIDGNAVAGTQLQASRRLAYLYLQKPIGSLTPRSLTVDGIVDDRGDAVAHTTRPITTILSDGAHVFGQVRDAGGAGVGGGVLTLMTATGPSSFTVSGIRTDLNGGFDFDFLARIGDSFTLTAQHPVTRDLAIITARVRGAGEQILLNPTFVGRGTVRGRVLAADGSTPQANLPIALIPGSVISGLGFQGSTNALGDFTFSDVPVGVFTLSASDGIGAFGQATGLIGHAGDVVSQNLVLVNQPDRGGRLAGRVFLSDGATPAAGFTVYVGTYKRDSGTVAAVDQATTDATGTFAFGQTLPPIVYDVVAVDPATSQVGVSQTSIVSGTTTSVSIILEAVGAIEGTVVNGRGERVAGALVAGGIALAQTDANGFFRMTGVPAGNRTIEAGDPVTKRRGSATVTVLPGQTVVASVTLESRATITGRVLDASGNPMPLASVRIPAIDGFTFVIANKQGVFTFPDQLLGDYLIQAPGPSADALISFMQANGIDPTLAFTSGDAPDGLPSPTPPAGDTNAVLAAYQQAVQTFFSVDESLLSGLPMATLGGFGWNKVALFQDATTVVADIKFLPQGTVAGRTVDSANRPTGAAVRISTLRVSTTGFPSFGELTRLNTDPATGTFSFGGVARFDLATFQAANVKAGDFTLEAANPFSAAHPQARGQLSTATPNVSDAVLQFPAAVDTNGTVSGHVFMPDGVTPVPAGTQVRISFGDLTVVTTESGAFSSPLPIPSGAYTVTAQTPSGLRGQSLALVPAGANVDIQMRVLGLGAVTITVKRSNGQPVPGAAVSLLRASFPGDHVEGVTNASGQIRFVNVTEGPFAVSAQETATGLSGRASAAVAADGEVAVPLVIAASGTVTGVFLSASGGQPIAFAQVALATGGVMAYASTDANGRFALAFIPVGAFTAEGFDPLTNRRGRLSSALQFEGQTVDITIVEAPRGTVRGVVLKADGVTGVPASRVSLASASFIKTSLQATALSDGSFRFDGVPAGSFTLDATDPVSGFTGTATGSVTVEGEVVDSNVTLAPFGSVHVTVLDVGGQPAANASVTIEGRQAAVDANGEFTFTNLSLGSYHAVARSLADSNSGGEASATIEHADQVVDVTVHLRGVGTVAVTVVPASGVGTVAGAEVTIDAHAAFGDGKSSPISTTLSGFTDGSGSVSFPTVPVGDFSVRAETGPLAGIATASVLTSGSTTAVQVRLGASGTVVGRVLLPDGVTAAARAFVTLRFQAQSAQQSGVLQVTTDLTGTFEFRGIPLGTVAVSAIEVVSSGVRSVTGALVSDGQRLDLGTLVLDNTAPRVVSVSPGDRSGSVVANVPIVITFSEPIATDSIVVTGDHSNISLFEGSTQVPLGVPTFSTDRTSVMLRPARDLASGRLEALTIRGAPDGPKDDSGFVVADSFLSTFSVRDSTPPVVLAIAPGAGATQIPLDSVVRVTFSEPLATASIVVRDGSNAPVAGSVSLAAGGTSAIFAPVDFLHANTSYSVSVTNVTDLAGNALAGGSATGNFATVDTLAPAIDALQVVGTPRVGGAVTVHASIAATDVQRVEYSLGAVLARTAVQAPFDAALTLPRDASSVTLMAVAFDLVGNRSAPFMLPIALQPNTPPAVTLVNQSGSLTVGQNQTINFAVHAIDDDQLAQLFFSAVGAASASVVQQATGTDLTQTFALQVPPQAASNSTITVQAAATDASGNQSVPAILTLTVRDAIAPTVAIATPVNNATVAPGQAVSVVVDAADDVALANVALICAPVVAGCESRPISPSAATSHQSFVVTVPDSLQAPQTIALSIVVTDSSGNRGTAGRVLQIADTIKPTIAALVTSSGSSRIDAGSNVGLRAAVADNVGVSSLTFSMDGGATGTVPVTPPIVSGNAAFSVTIPAATPNGTAIAVHVRARDSAGNLSDEASLVLTVGDAAAPALTVLEPVNGASVAPGGSITVRATATDDVGVSRFVLTVAGAFTDNESRDVVPAATPASATFVVAVPSSTPAGALTVTVEAFDASGHSSGPTARTMSVSDVVAPAVQIVSPAQNALVDPRSPISIVVNATDAVGVSSMTFSASGAATSSETRAIAPPATSRTETFNVGITPLPSTGGTLVLNATARDAAANLGSAATVTVRILDVVAPDVLATVPASGATGVDRQAPIVVRFSEPMDRATLTAASVRLRRGTTVEPTALVVGGSDDVVTLTPTTQPLAANTLFTIEVSTAAADKAGNALASARAFTFTTASPDTNPPKVAAIDPPNNAVDVSIVTPIDVTFSEAVDPATVTAQSFRVRIDGVTVPGSLTILAGNIVARFTPDGPLPTETVVTTELTGAITDALGNALVAADGSPLTTPLSFTFLTGRFALSSPAGAQVAENSTVLLEVRSSAALNVATVLFTVNGQALPPVSGPPFTRPFAVGPASTTPSLTIVASGRDASGNEVAHDQHTFDVVVGLKASPALVGVPIGGVATVRYSLSSALSSDLPITLAAGDPALVTFPVNPVVLAAGRTSVDATIAGIAAGATAVLASSARGPVATVVAVSAPQSGQPVTADAAAAGASLSNPAAVGFVALAAGTTQSARLTLRSPALAGAIASIVTTNASVATATVSAVVAGQSFVDVQVSATGDGVATVIVRIGNEAFAFTVFVGVPPAGSVPILTASPVGLTISNAPIAAQIVASAGRDIVLVVPVLAVPASVVTPVTVTSGDPSIATASAGIVPIGGTSVTVTVHTVANGVTTLVLHAGADVRSVIIVVGTPAANATPVLVAKPIGVGVLSLPTIGRAFAPLGAVRSLILRLFTAPVASDTPVVVTTSDASVVSVTDGAIVRAGDQTVSLQISTGSGGTATLTIEAGGQRDEFTLVVGSDPTPRTTPPIVAAPVGAVVLQNPSIGRVFGAPGGGSSTTLGIPLLPAPLGVATSVAITSSNPSIASLGGGATTTVTISAGDQVLRLPVALAGTEGASVLTLEFNGQRRELLIIVGNPPAAQIPAVTAPVVGVRIGG